jgi:hypothetical protein
LGEEVKKQKNYELAEQVHGWIEKNTEILMNLCPKLSKEEARQLSFEHIKDQIPWPKLENVDAAYDRWISRESIVTYAMSRGWKPWGNLRDYDGSSYQCFRRGNKYAWIGLVYVEHCDYGRAFAFINPYELPGAMKLLE